MKREEWLDEARKLDWDFSYVSEEEVFPEAMAGSPWLRGSEWRDWDEPYRTTYAEYVTTQARKEQELHARWKAQGSPESILRLDRSWLSALKLHGATLPLAEFAAVIGNLRAGRFGRDSAWRTTATFGALDELRHTQLPLRLFAPLVAQDPQFEWVARFFHTQNWLAIAARHLTDELLLASDPLEFAVGAHFVFETGFTNLQFVGLAAVARQAGDPLFETLLQSIQTDEARHAQVGPPVLSKLVERDPERAQYLLDKWFWRSWMLFSVITGFAMDYLTPVAKRERSFQQLVEEWLLDQFQEAVDEIGLRRPWYWDTFLAEVGLYHHMVYASAYTYRATTWLDLPIPGPEERAWLARHYPETWPHFDPVWQRITDRATIAGPGLEWYTHGATPVAFCHLCQLLLSNGTPRANTARIAMVDGKKRMFCSEPCQWIFGKEPERYSDHRDVVERILHGAAPANLMELLAHFGLDASTWGKDAHGGRYDWMRPR